MKTPLLPHLNLFTRLKPSAIHGVGVFAIRDIPKGTRLFDNDEEIIWIEESQLRRLPSNIRKIYDDFCIIKDGKYGCPSDFNSLTMAWYLNDSSSPNVDVDADYNMRASRDIVDGEELTIDSSKFSKQPYRNLTVAAK
jgi:SET domain-containing protein